MGSVNIKTGADKLVELVSSNKRVNLDDAAKKLGVGKDVVREWAEFLEEEGLVSLEYSLSKMFICEKKITASDILSAAKEVSSEKDAIARRIDVALTSLQKDTSGFEDIRKQFNNIQKNIKGEIDIVKKQLDELERYDSLRKGLDKDVSKQRLEYDSFVKEIEGKLHVESQKYDDLKDVIERERKAVEQYITKIEELKKLKSDYEHTVNSLKVSLKNIDSMLSDYGARIASSSKNMSDHKEALEKLQAGLSDKRDSAINKRMTELKSNQERLMKSQASVEKDILSKTGSMESYTSISDKIHKSFDGFFSKNISTEKLISEIEGDKLDLAKDFEMLKSKVLKFTLMSAHVDAKSQMKGLEEELKTLEKKRSSIASKIEKLMTMIKGNGS